MNHKLIEVSRPLSLKLAAASVVIASALALSACTAATPNAASSSGPTWDSASQQYTMEPDIASGKKPLTLWVEYQPYGDALAAAFEKKYPKVHVQIQLVPKKEADTKLSLDGPAGKGPDVFTTNFDHLASAVKTSVAGPMGEYSSGIKKRAGTSFTSAATVNGTVYAVPISTESLALFYNSTLLKKLTGSSTPATNWDDIKSLASSYNKPAANQWTIRFTPSAMYYTYPMVSDKGWRAYAGGNMAKPGFDSKALTEGLKSFASLRSVWNISTGDATYDAVENAFAQGATPYVITGPWAIPDFDKAATAKNYKYGVTTLPTLSTDKKTTSMGGVAIAAVSTYSKYPGAARVLANFMSTKPGATALYSSIGAIPAVTKDLAAKIPGLSSDKHAAGILAQSQNADFINSVPEYFWTVGDALAVSVWDNTATVDVAQARAVAEYKNLANLAK